MPSLRNLGDQEPLEAGFDLQKLIITIDSDAIIAINIVKQRGSGENQADSLLLVRACPVIDCGLAVIPAHKTRIES